MFRVPVLRRMRDRWVISLSLPRPASPRLSVNVLCGDYAPRSTFPSPLRHPTARYDSPFR